MADSMIYMPDVMVSLNTCRPISTTDYDAFPIFWCETCKVDMRRPVIAIQHLIGKDHLSKMKKSGKFPKQAIIGTKRKKDIEMVGYENIPLKKLKGPSSTPKPLVSPSLRGNLDPDAQDEKNCKLCDVKLSSGDDAKQHYAGKRHREAVTTYKEQKNSKINVQSYSGGRGRGFGVQSSGRGGLGTSFGVQSLGRGGRGRGFGVQSSGRGGLGTGFGRGFGYVMALELEVNLLRRQVSAFMGTRK